MHHMLELFSPADTKIDLPVSLKLSSERLRECRYFLLFKNKDIFERCKCIVRYSVQWTVSKNLIQVSILSIWSISGTGGTVAMFYT